MNAGKFLLCAECNQLPDDHISQYHYSFSGVPYETCIIIEGPEEGDCDVALFPCGSPSTDPVDPSPSSPTPGRFYWSSGGPGGSTTHEFDWYGGGRGCIGDCRCKRCALGEFEFGGGVYPPQTDCRLTGVSRDPRRSLADPHRFMEEECPTCDRTELQDMFIAVDNAEDDFVTVEAVFDTCAREAEESGSTSGAILCLFSQTLPFLGVLPELMEILDCQLAQEACTTEQDRIDFPGLANLLIQARRFHSFIDIWLVPLSSSVSATTPFNSSSVNSSVAATFASALFAASADDGDEGQSISSAELESLLEVGVEVPNGDAILRFADLWNASLPLWESGVYRKEDLPANTSSVDFFDIGSIGSILSGFLEARAQVRNEYYNSLADAWLSAVEGHQFEEARKLAGVCASVRVRILQELTLTRVGFEAQLEIRNDGEFPMENISVSLRASPAVNFTEDATDLFVGFDRAELSPSIDGISGNGTLGANNDASIKWLLVALSEAALMEDTRYGITGTLLYTINGVEYIQNLAPDTITVRPDPQLHLKYFWPRTSYSDDPFTADVIEPAVSFPLCLLIENRGYGNAYNVEIVSSQPEIIGNEKGLLVDFSIIGARMNNASMSSSLTINFGTVSAHSNVIGVWEMVSSLRGKFSNFSATFEYQGVLDDDRLSLIDSVEIFELTHLVHVVGDHPAMADSPIYVDDGLDDFLVNLLPDAFYIPDTVFTSDTSDSNFSIDSVVDAGWSVVTDNLDDTITVLVHHNDTTVGSDWVYIRFDDELGSSDYILQTATRVDSNYTLVPDSNSWQTSWVDILVDDSVDEQYHVHLFDYGVAETYQLVYALQQPVTNLRITEATNHSLSIAWDPAIGATASYIIIKPTLSDDESYWVAKEFVQIDSYTIRHLSAGMSYSITVFTGRRGRYERTGATVVGSTTGASLCGDRNVDTGEECDDGSSNGTPDSLCTAECRLKFVPPQEPSSYPSGMPSSHPSLRATEAPLTRFCDSNPCRRWNLFCRLRYFVRCRLLGSRSIKISDKQDGGGMKLSDKQEGPTTELSDEQDGAANIFLREP
jgi:hypothetical protein